MDTVEHWCLRSTPLPVTVKTLLAETSGSEDIGGFGRDSVKRRELFNLN